MHSECLGYSGDEGLPTHGTIVYGCVRLDFAQHLHTTDNEMDTETEIDGGGRREPLTPARITEAAIAILDADGLAGLTMRKLGVALSVEAMSLYRYFSNKNELLAAVREALFDEIAETPDGRGDWKERLRTVMRSTYHLCRRHPSFLIALFDIPSTPNSILRGVRDLETLRNAGFDDKDARAALATLVVHVVGSLHQSRAPVNNVMVGARRREAAFEFGLETILEGLDSRLRRA
jgi:AcrR family transcriptional regulator